MMRKTYAQKMAFTGIIAALCVVVLFLTGIVPIATIALPALAGCLLIAVVVEAGVKWAFGAYAGCSLLSLLLVPDREAALFFIVFFGYYPALYAILGRIKNVVIRWITKLAVFNAAMFLEVFVSVKFLNIPIEEIPFFGQNTVIVLFLLLNAVFIIYDKAFDGLIFRYIKVVQPKIKKMFRF